MNRCVAIIITLLLFSVSCTDDKKYKQQDLSDRERAADLTSHLTLEEKISLLGGLDGMRTNPIPRLGIPSLNLVNGPNGVGDKPGTAFPAGVGMAASWNEELIHQIGIAIGEEARAKKVDILLGPCVNIHRIPLGGRNFESYSEDPFLAGRMGVNFVRGVQSLGVAASLKHFALNNQESSRSSYDAELDERTLREIYLPAFEMTVKEAQPMTVMAAYNLFRGEHCTQNRYLLTDILRDEWGFEGFVMSDWDATHSTIPAAKGGLDLEMPGRPKFFNNKLLDAVREGRVSDAEIDKMVVNVLSVYFKMGIFNPRDSLPEGELDTPAHRVLAVQAAREAIVLLKNQGSLLPLDKSKIKTIALIGPNATINRVGGGGSSEVKPFYSVTPLEAFRNKLGDEVKLFFHEGLVPEQEEMPVIGMEYLIPPDAWAGEHGLKAEFFNNEKMHGDPVVTRIDDKIDFDWGQGSPDQAIRVDRFSARWTGKLIAPVTGRIRIGITSNDGSYLYINDRLVVNNWGMHGPLLRSAEVEVEAGKEYDIKVEYNDAGNNAMVSLTWQLEPRKNEYEPKAVKLARETDVAIVFAGLNSKIESEGYDRETMDLPGAQAELIRAVAKANKNTIVVINSGTPVTMTEWLDQVPAVVQAWYLGQETGNAVADVLFGDYNPSGKLPVTFPKQYEDHPAYGSYLKEIDKAIYEEGLFVGYRYYDSKHVEPLFPFGHGLSYTTFEYSDLKTDLDGNLPVTVTLTVTNSGKVKGSEVVQLYVHDVEASVIRPFKELKGFSKVDLEAGESKRVTIYLDRRVFSFYDDISKKWVLEPGAFEILAGASSKDIRLKQKIQL
ncbi:MAG: glycoside hydrolase family 3 C-terminal domain-containing protein [Bacteroidota bacterium]